MDYKTHDIIFNNSIDWKRVRELYFEYKQNKRTKRIIEHIQNELNQRS